MKLARIALRTTFRLSFGVYLVLLTGCGSFVGGSGPGFGGGPTSQNGGFDGGVGPGAPGNTGANGPDNTPLLGGDGGWGGAATPPPGVVPTGPSAPVNFDSATEAVFAKYNARLTGGSLTAQRAERIARALQLYKTRRHTITFIVQQDDSKMPISAVWRGSPEGASVSVYQPDMQHTINHEVAHDMTLAVDEGAGERLRANIRASVGDAGTFPSEYSKSSSIECMAETVSFLAAIHTKMPIDEQPYSTFRPNGNIQNDCKAFFSEKVLANAR